METRNEKAAPRTRQKKSRLIQIAAGVSPGDAITNDLLEIDSFFKKKNSPFVQTRIYAGAIDPRLRALVRPIHQLESQKSDLLLVHYGAHIPYLSRILASEAPAMLVYHNITPARFYERYNLKTAGELKQARRELWSLGSRFFAAFADSIVNKKELECYGFPKVQLRPICIPFLLQRQKAHPLPSSPPSQKPELFTKEKPGKIKRILFTGRISPNKGHVHLIKAFFLLHQRCPQTRLIFAGKIPADIPGYFQVLQKLLQSLALKGKVLFTGFLSDEKLKKLYQKADLFACFSEHEGFCVPLLEAMAEGVPVLALDALGSAIKDTMQNSGVLFRLSYANSHKTPPMQKANPPAFFPRTTLLEKESPPSPASQSGDWRKEDYLRASLLMEEMLYNPALRQALVKRQNEQLKKHDFLEGLRMIETEWMQKQSQNPF